MSYLPEYNKKIPTIVVRWKLEGGVEVALEVPLPVDHADERNRIGGIMDTVTQCLEPWMQEPEA